MAHNRGELSRAQAWYEKSLALKEECGDRPGLVLSYGMLAMLAEDCKSPLQALFFLIRAIALFPDFPHPLTRSAPAHLARLTASLGMPALEATWQQVTGHPLPPNVRAYVEATTAPA